MAPSWNLIIMIGAGAIIAYGFFLQKDKIQATLISAYIALAVTSIWGDQIYQILSGNQVIFNSIWFHGNFNPFTLKAILFVGFIVLLSFRSKIISSKTAKISSSAVSLAYSALTAFLIISSLLAFMPVAQRQPILIGSKIADFIYNFRTWWVLLPALMMIFVSATSGAESSTASSAAKTTPRVNNYYSRKEARRRRY